MENRARIRIEYWQLTTGSEDEQERGYQLIKENGKTVYKNKTHLLIGNWALYETTENSQEHPILNRRNKAIKYKTVKSAKKELEKRARIKKGELEDSLK